MLVDAESRPLIEDSPNSSYDTVIENATVNNGIWSIDKGRKSARNKLLMAAFTCFVFMIGEIVGGYLSGSLAIMTDAAHLLSDFASMLISLFSLWIAGRPATQKLSFGYHRAEIIGALFSVFLIWLLTGFLVYEAVLRLIHRKIVNGKIMFITAACGLCANIFMALALGHGHSHGHSHHHHDADEGHSHRHSNHSHIHETNESEGSLTSHDSEETEDPIMTDIAAYLHVLGDLIQSLGVLIASVVLWIRPEFTIVDPICTLLFSVIVMLTTISITRDATLVLMEGTPRGFDRLALIAALEAIPGVAHTHDLHVWSLTTGKHAMAVHLQLEESAYLSERRDTILVRAQHVACRKFGVHHSTIQIESFGNRNHCQASKNECNSVCG
ncbi:proton-coupled zinc antiporter SLC30A2-like isoform X2 [Zophobas morio]|uniref:proton-coupled zinc antiporter SLC30A2-like isoform X2 n=1 Tax=Zophobas morio TaxID=2755281 RepID=UPI003083E231